MRRHLFKEDISMANNKHVKRLLTSFVIRETQIKTTMSIISYPVRWLEFRKKKGIIISIGKDVEKLESLYIYTLLVYTLFSLYN